MIEEIEDMKEIPEQLAHCSKSLDDTRKWVSRLEDALLIALQSTFPVEAEALKQEARESTLCPLACQIRHMDERIMEINERTMLMAEGVQL